MKRLCATVLGMEAVVLALAILPAIKLSHLAPHAAGLTGGIAAAAALALAGLARRHLPATLVAGTVLQVYVIVAGVIVPVMYVLGAIFAALWVTGIWLGYRTERATGP